MNKIFSKIGLAVLLLAGTTSLTSCEENDFDMIGTSSNQEPYVTSQTSVGEVNATILEVKERFCSNSATATFFRNDKNFYSRVDEDIVITGVVVANDISGNLYQTLLIRNMEPSGEDQCIILGVKNTCLYPYFQLGQRIKVNLKGLWVGVYSQVPRIGQPVKSSWDNLNLGPMLFELLRENVELVGRPDPSGTRPHQPNRNRRRRMAQSLRQQGILQHTAPCHHPRKHSRSERCQPRQIGLRL